MITCCHPYTIQLCIVFRWYFFVLHIFHMGLPWIIFYLTLLNILCTIVKHIIYIPIFHVILSCKKPFYHFQKSHFFGALDSCCTLYPKITHTTSAILTFYYALYLVYTLLVHQKWINLHLQNSLSLMYWIVIQDRLLVTVPTIPIFNISFTCSHQRKLFLWYSHLCFFMIKYTDSVDSILSLSINVLVSIGTTTGFSDTTHFSY